MNTNDDKFSYKLERVSDGLVVHLIGMIDEDVDFSELQKIEESIYFNFKNIKSINSLGIRSWVNLLKSMKSSHIYFVDCPPMIVRQMNMVPSFKLNAEVLSVEVPFVCNHCDHEKIILLEVSELDLKQVSLPNLGTCEMCRQGIMELDGEAEQYFSFLEEP